MFLGGFFANLNGVLSLMAIVSLSVTHILSYFSQIKGHTNLEMFQIIMEWGHTTFFTENVLGHYLEQTQELTKLYMSHTHTFRK